MSAGSRLGIASSSALVEEPGIRVRGKAARAETYWHADICALMARLFDVLGALGPSDRKIVEAVCREGNLRAAARALAPEQPYYRTFVQRKVKAYREVLARLADDTELAAFFARLEKLEKLAK